MSYYFNGSTTTGENRMRMDASLTGLGGTERTFTFAIWIKPDDVTPGSAGNIDHYFSIGRQDTTSDHIAWLGIANTGNALVGVIMGGNQSTAVADGSADAQLDGGSQPDWMLVAGSLTFNASGLLSRRKVLAFNGAAEASAELDIATPALDMNAPNRIHLGENINGNNEFTGHVAHAAIWTKELTGAEFTELTTKTPDQVATADLAYYWPLLANAEAHASYGGSSFNFTTIGAGASLNNGDGPTLSTGATPTITEADDEVFFPDEIDITITGTNFGAAKGSGAVLISPTDDVDDAGAVTQADTSWSDTSITITAVRGSLAFNATAYLFVKETGGTSNASGRAVTFNTRGSQRRMMLGVG